MSRVIESLEQRQLRSDLPPFKAGAGVRETFTVRKQSFGVGVERTFPLHSPKIERIEVTAIGDVNRAKLYYLRGKVGKRARVRAKRGVALPVIETPAPTESDMPPEDATGPETEAESETAEEPAEEPEAAVEQPAAEPVPE